MPHRRIRCFEVREAYVRMGMYPVYRKYYDATGFGACAIGVLYVFALQRMPNHVPVEVPMWHAVRWAKKRFGAAYVEGFVAGFDVDFTATLHLIIRPGRRWIGWLDGIRVRLAVQRKGGNLQRIAPTNGSPSCSVSTLGKQVA